MSKRWVFLPPHKTLQSEIASKLKISPLMAQVLINRGVLMLPLLKIFFSRN